MVWLVMRRSNTRFYFPSSANFTAFLESSPVGNGEMSGLKLVRSSGRTNTTEHFENFKSKLITLERRFFLYDATNNSTSHFQIAVRQVIGFTILAVPPRRTEGDGRPNICQRYSCHFIITENFHHRTSPLTRPSSGKVL